MSFPTCVGGEIGQLLDGLLLHRFFRNHLHFFFNLVLDYLVNLLFFFSNFRGENVDQPQ